MKESKIRCIHECAASILTRSWLRAGKYFVDYIVNSSERPLGPVKKYWWRWEYQEANGNVPHIHALFWTGEVKHGVSLQQIQKRVACSTLVYHQPRVKNLLIELGLIKHSEDSEIYVIIDECGRIQRHSCAGCNYRCRVRKGEGDDDVECRYRNYFEISKHPSRYMYFPCNANHTPEAVNVLSTCGLVEQKMNGGITNLHPKLNGGFYTYPAEPNENLSPFSPVLFAWTRCSSNIQICDTYLCSRYLAKYVQGIDENLKVELKSFNHGESAVLEEKVVYNTKVSTSGYYEKIRSMKNNKKQNKHVGRAIGVPEILSLIFQVPQVYTNVSFVHIPTCALEFRSGIENIRPKKTDYREEEFVQIPYELKNAAQERNEGLDIPCQDVRRNLNFPTSRRFTMLQEQMMKDVPAT